MSILYAATCIVGIVFMVVFMFIGIWLFIVALKAYHQLKYKNFILEKIYQKIGSDKNTVDNDVLSDTFDFFDLEKENAKNDFNLTEVRNDKFRK